MNRKLWPNEKKVVMNARLWLIAGLNCRRLVRQVGKKRKGEKSLAFLEYFM